VPCFCVLFCRVKNTKFPVGFRKLQKTQFFALFIFKSIFPYFSDYRSAVLAFLRVLLVLREQNTKFPVLHYEQNYVSLIFFLILTLYNFVFHIFYYRSEVLGDVFLYGFVWNKPNSLFIILVKIM
jgi:hypothetical protein